jgi:hypothetical protein
MGSANIPGSTSPAAPLQAQISSLLRSYPQDRPLYEDLVRDSRAKCEEILNDLDIRGVVTGRVKALASLRKKLEGLARDQQFADWFAQSGNIYQHPDIGDLAGVRIGLYFTEGLSRLSKAIAQHFVILHRFGRVGAGRYPTEHTNKDIESYKVRAWRDDAGNTWAFTGCKSWQVLVE